MKNDECSWISRPLDMVERMQLEDIRENLGDCCEVCGSKKNLTIHHIKSRKEYPELMFEISNCQRLCDKCHKKIKESGT